MFIRDLQKSKEFIADDSAILRELFNPIKDNIQLRYSLAHAIVKPGQITCNHRLKTSEVYYVIQGKEIIYINEEKAEVKEGQAIYIPLNSKQMIKNIGNEDLIFLCIVDPAWKNEDEEIF